MTTPLSMGRVALIVHDLERVSDFYQRVIGLHLLKRGAKTAQLGVDETVLLELRGDPSARQHSPRDAGLFHTAFLLPTRADLGAWMKHAARTRAPIVGAADHAVSEAIYLVDPEGNGVEIYADRPALSWKKANGFWVMGSDPLHLEELIASAGSQDWHGFPGRSTVGHVHLQVGAIAPAEAFYAGVLGLPITCRYPGGTFYAAGHYHHHLATNIWNSRGASMRSEPSTGLADVEVIADSTMLDAVRAKRQDGGRLAEPGSTADNGPLCLSLRDPWGTSITLIAR